MELFIVDASVGAKWFFEEESAHTARKLIERFKAKEIRIMVPDLFYAELGNIFRTRVRRRQNSSMAAFDAFDVLIGFGLERYPDYELSDMALGNGIQFGLSVYDAVYLSLAEIYMAPLVTADDFLIKACRNKFDFILPLGELR